jgi:hypothetical protein
MRTKRAGSSDASTDRASGPSIYDLPSGLEADVVVLRLDVVDSIHRQHVDLRDRRGSARARAAPGAAVPQTPARRPAATSFAARRSRARDSASAKRWLAERLQQVVDRVDSRRRAARTGRTRS